MTDALFGEIVERWFSGEEIGLPAQTRITFSFGTREWSDDTFNSHAGCPHGCLNCYARNLAWDKNFWYKGRYGKECVRREIWDKGWQRRPDGYWIMYPSVHDIPEEISGDVTLVLRKLLDANINVLLVTKGVFASVRRILGEIPESLNWGQPHVRFRLSIPTLSEEEVAFWEPGAPSIRERMWALRLLFEAGGDVGVSSEPFYMPRRESWEAEPIRGVVRETKERLEYISDTLWLGLMNHIPGAGAGGARTLRGRRLAALEAEKFEELERLYSDENILRLVRELHGEEKVRWKESIKKTLIRLIGASPSFDPAEFGG
jgi:hypothetical protein